MSCSFLLRFVVAQLMTNDHNTFGDELVPRRFGNRHACYPFIDSAPDVEEPFGVGLSGHLHRTGRFLAHPGISPEKKPDDTILSSLLPPCSPAFYPDAEHHFNAYFRAYFRARRSSSSHELSESPADDSQTVKIHLTSIEMHITMSTASVTRPF
jgi:hypothetical protein